MRRSPWISYRKRIVARFGAADTDHSAFLPQPIAGFIG
jgi:hypothetical protein